MVSKRILIMSDATGSMGIFLATLRPMLQDLVPMLQLVFPSFQLGCVFYRDYDSSDVVVINKYTTNYQEIYDFIAKHAKAIGGGDEPEAQKTALMNLLTNNVLDHNTLVIHYTDSPPHYDGQPTCNNGLHEYNYFKKNNWNHDWNDIVGKVRQTGATIITITNIDSIFKAIHYSYKDIGKIFYCTTRSSDIMKITMTAIQDELLGSNINFTISFKDISNRLRSDEAYFNNVIDILLEQLNRRNVDGAIDILCNKVTSEIWRSLGNYRTNDKVIKLKNTMSTIANGNSIKHTELQQLIEKSFDRKMAFNELYPNLSGTLRCFTRSNIRKIAVTNLQDIFSCFAKQEISHLLLFIQNMQEVTFKYDTITEDFTFADADVIPIDVEDKLFFSSITHLITPGYITSLRQSAIIALLCRNDQRLEQRATDFLNSIKGKWINHQLQSGTLTGFIYPENLNAAFSHFLLSPINRQFLTEDEITMLSAFINMTNISYLIFLLKY